ncbi:MAG: sugar phosphate nucleotidyltransferase [Candidatus Berkelbacteria bacterium]|nr:sugar phosphate nucleotidyltransferase [Candidatus Berkelbacteria bacterium]
MINGKKAFAIIMAAGKGTRIGAVDKPKVMFEVAGKPIIGWAIEPFVKLKKEGLFDRVITVVGFHGNQVIDYLGEKSEYVWQKEQLGTGHAVIQAENLIGNEEGITLIVNGDHALYTAGTFRKMIETASKNNLTLGFAVVITPNRFGSYGRIIRDKNGKVLAVVEVPEASEEQLKIAERSPSVFVADNKWLFSALPRIPLSPVKKEYYVNTIVELAIKDGKKVETVEIENEDEALGINTHEDREEVESILKKRLAKG